MLPGKQHLSLGQMAGPKGMQSLADAVGKMGGKQKNPKKGKGGKADAKGDDNKN